MAQMEYAYKVPAEFKAQLLAARAALKNSSAEEGMIRRYLVACEFDAPRCIVELLMHTSAPLDACACIVCAGGMRRSFKMSGELLSITPLEWQRDERGHVGLGMEAMMKGQHRKRTHIGLTNTRDGH